MRKSRTAVIDYIEQFCAALPGVHISRHESDGKPSLVAAFDDVPAKALILNAHVDVVPGRPDQFQPGGTRRAHLRSWHAGYEGGGSGDAPVAQDARRGRASTRTSRGSSSRTRRSAANTARRICLRTAIRASSSWRASPLTSRSSIAPRASCGLRYGNLAIPRMARARGMARIRSCRWLRASADCSNTTRSQPNRCGAPRRP